MVDSPKRVVLCAPEVDNLRRLVEQGLIDRIRTIPLGEVTIDGAVELACSWWSWQHDGQAAILAQLAQWAREHELLGRVWAALRDGYEDDVDLFAAPSVEVRAAPRDKAAISSTTWSTYFSRFTRSLITNGGFEKKLSYGITRAFEEMVDNVVQHSGITTSAAAPGVVGYHVHRGEMTYAVGDCGRGVLESLRTNPQWRELLTSRAALDAAICAHATRRLGEKEGYGFQEVHRSLADVNGRLRFRSGDAVLILDGRGNARQGIRRNSPPLAGFQLSVSCAHGGR